MFRHCVMFKWADDATDATKALIATGLDRLAGLDCVASYHHGPDLSVSEGNWDYAVVGDFESQDHYRQYAVEEGHVELIETLIKPSISARAAVQYDVTTS